MKRFEGKVVIVTGASSGIGEAVALLLGGEGAKVVVADRRVQEGNAVTKKIKDEGGEAIFIQTDVTKKLDIVNLIDTTVKTFGKLDCAVNNAGIAGKHFTPTADIEEEDWDDVINTNLKGVFLCMKYEIRAMLQNGKGAIVNVSSVYGSKPSDIGHAHYAASKFGLKGLSKTAAIDYGQQGIRVNQVSPGFTHSGMLDPFLKKVPKEFVTSWLNRYRSMNGVADAIEVAQAVAWLCSDAASSVTGADLTVDGGDCARLY